MYKRQVDISPEAIEENRAYVFINKESQRIRKESLNALDGKDVLLVFPTNHKKNSTVRILKTPKTESSVRKIFLPKSVANMLVDWKAEQDEMKEILGDEYMDYNLVMASRKSCGRSGSIQRRRKRLWKRSWRIFLPSSTTVSYTHLDVYKRQIKSLTWSRMNRALG